MTSDSEPVTIANMLRRIDTARSDFDRALDGAQPVTANGWAPKDHMAHIACWEHSALNLVDGKPRFAHLGLSIAESGAMDHDAINERVYLAYRDEPLERVAAYYDTVHRDLVARLTSMSDEDLLKPYSHYQPNDPPRNENPVWPWIAGNTFGHYAEHAAILRAP